MFAALSRPRLVPGMARSWRSLALAAAAESSSSTARPQVISITKAAAERIQALLQHRQEPCLGVRVGVRKRGCNGLSYTMDYATEKKKFDEVVTDHGVTVIVDALSVMHLLGTQMDFVENRLKAEFVFTNPNAKSFCGCGESFNV